MDFQQRQNYLEGNQKEHRSQEMQVQNLQPSIQQPEPEEARLHQPAQIQRQSHNENHQQSVQLQIGYHNNINPNVQIESSIKIEEQIQIIFADFKDAIKRGDSEKISELLQKHREFDLANKIDPISKQTSIFLATLITDHQKSLDIIKILIDHGVNLHYKDSLKQNCMFYLCREGNYQAVQLLSDKQVPVDDPDNYGQTPLYYACREGKIETLKTLVQIGVNLNHIDNISKQTALFYAAREGHVNICKYLIENGCDYQIQDQKRQTALNYAKKFQRKTVIEYLQQINFQNKEKKKQMTYQKEENLSRQSVDKVMSIKQNYKLVYLDKQIVNEQRLCRSLTEDEIQMMETQYELAMKYLRDPSLIDSSMLEQFQNTEKWENVAKKVLNNLWKMKGSYLFHQPVDPVRYNILDYNDIISSPMDFGTIKFKLNNGVYVKMQEFVEDMKLVFDNCVLYNGANSDVGRIGIDLQNEFVNQCQKEKIDFAQFRVEPQTYYYSQ